jgi:hypothetical protein
MPIVRNYMCPECGAYWTVTLSHDQWNDPPPECERCARQAQQEFQPFAIGGSDRARAEKITEDILEKDYHVGDIERDHRAESIPKVRYQDQGRPANPATWGAARAALESAISVGRDSRKKYGSGLDVLQANLKSGAEPDLIEISKRRALRVS